MAKVHEVAREACPTYLVVKDMFDTIDIRKDGVIDLHEWQQTFGRVADDPQNQAIGASPLTNWENSKEFEKIGALIAKNRKQLKEQFRRVLGEATAFTFADGKKAMDTWMYSHFKDSKLSAEQLKCVFKPAQVPSLSQACPKYDYLRMLDIYRARHCAPQV